MMRNVMLVMVGGAVGSGARYLVSLYPHGTLMVNVVGSLLLGVVLARATGDWKLLLGAGVMGGFTTYSTFNAQTLELIQRGALPSALGYVALTLGLCLLGGVVGQQLGLRLSL